MTKALQTMALALAVALTAVGCGSSDDPKAAIVKAKVHREKGDHKAAIIELKNALQKDAANHEARYLLGASYFDNRDYRAAQIELDRALEMSYERSKVLPVLGRTLLMQGQAQNVIDRITVDRFAPNAVQADVHTLRARALMGLGQADKAREEIEAALAKQPEFADAMVELARLAAIDQKPDEAARLIDRVIVVAPKQVEAWLIRGDLARVKGDEAAFVAANEKVIEIDATNIPARLNLASLHVANNKLDEARKRTEQARTLSPGNVLVMQMQALVDFRARDYKAANEASQQVLKVAPNYLPGVLLAGAILAEQGSHEQAQVHLGRVLERAPGNLYVRKLLISSLLRSGQMQRAKEVLLHALEQAPDNSELMTLAGDVHLQNGEFKKATEYFDKAARLDPKNANARTRLGVSRMAAGDTDRAFADLESAAAADDKQYGSDLVLIVSHLRRGSFDQALNAVASLEKKQPDNPVTFNLKGVVFLGKQDIANARKNFERALQLQPAFLAAATNLAQLDIRDKNPKGARARLESVLEKNKNSLEPLLVLVELGPALGATPVEMRDWLERARKVTPQSVSSLSRIARLYMQMGDNKTALEMAQKSLADKPESPELLDLVGTAQARNGQTELALTTYRKLVKLQPKSPYALYRLAGAQAGSTDYAAATDTLRQALALKPDFVDAQSALVPLEIRAKRYEQAINIVQQMQKQNAKDPTGYLLEGDVLIAQQKFAQAIKAYETVQGMTPNAGVLAKLHTAYAAAGRVEEGDARLAQWLKAFPDDLPVRFFAGEAALKRGLFKEAIAQYEWLQQKQPDNAVVLNNLAWAYAQVNDVRALATAERGHKLMPDNAAVADTFGYLLIQHGEVDRGIALLEKAAKAEPKLADIHYHIAQGWIKKGDKPKARGALERALSINAKFSDSAEAAKQLKQLRE